MLILNSTYRGIVEVEMLILHSRYRGINAIQGNYPQKCCHSAMDKEMLFKYQISALSILWPSRASTSGLYIPSRLWRKPATQFSSVKPLEARSRRSRGSRTRCPSTSRPTPDWAWWSKVNCEVRRRWQFGRFYIRISLNILSNFLENNRYFNCSCFV